MKKVSCAEEIFQILLTHVPKAFQYTTLPQFLLLQNEEVRLRNGKTGLTTSVKLLIGSSPREHL